MPCSHFRHNEFPGLDLFDHPRMIGNTFVSHPYVDHVGSHALRDAQNRARDVLGAIGMRIEIWPLNCEFSWYYPGRTSLVVAWDPDRSPEVEAKYQEREQRRARRYATEERQAGQ